MHRIRQSDVVRFRHCPELHRVTMMGEVADREGDTAEIGSAMHAGAEYTLRTMLAGDLPAFADANEAAQLYWANAWRNPAIMCTEIPTEEYGAALVYDCLERWWNEILPEVVKNGPIVDVERQFDVVAYEDEERQIRLCGMADLWLPTDIWDWKSSDRMYSGPDAWKYQRGYLSVQHIFYPWARELIKGTNPLKRKGELAYSFTYWVVPRNGEKVARDGTVKVASSDHLRIQPTCADTRFLLEELLSLCYLVESDAPKWPLGPTDWWCSSKWCEHWSECRGKHHGPDPWGLLERLEIQLKKKGKK